MIVEHTFVTTLEEDDALLLADALFTHIALERVPGTMNQWTAGKDRPRKIAEVRRVVRVEFDRGRVSLAASALTIAKAQEKLYQPYLLALASAAEAHISAGLPVDQAAAPVLAVGAEIDRKDRKSRITVYIILGVVLACIAGIVILAAVLP